MFASAPQLLGPSAHIVWLPQAACGQLHMSFWNMKLLLCQVASLALDLNFGCAGIAANAAVADIASATMAAASSTRVRFSICIAFRIGCLGATVTRISPAHGTLQ